MTVGTHLPDFDLETSDGGRVSNADLEGHRTILYFYPKDDTPGCTTEALNFTEKAKDFTKAGAVVVGVSRDSAAKHDKFAAKYGLKVQLAADEDGDVCNRYGVWVEKSLYGRQYMGIERTTYLIDEKAKIRRIWRKVRVKDHAEEVLAEVNAL
jgi:thioredoxin-dependent peroxiredoxin